MKTQPIWKTFKKKHPEYRRVCDAIKKGSEMLYVERAKDQKPIGNCYWNVHYYVTKRGGSAINGWIVHVWESRMVSAMHHCIWQDGDGRLLDVTKTYPSDTASEIAFIMDDKFSGDIYGVNHFRSILIALGDPRKCEEFINAYNFKNEVERANQKFLLEIGYQNEQNFIAAGFEGVKAFTGARMTQHQIIKNENIKQAYQAAMQRFNIAIDSLF